MFSLPVIAEVVMFFNFSAVGLALAWLATVWGTAMLAGWRWDAALVAASPILIFQVFTNFSTRWQRVWRSAAYLAWGRRNLPGRRADRPGVAAKLYPLLLLLLVVLALRTDRAADAARTVVATVGAWFLVNLPVMMLFPAVGRSSSGELAPR